ncbi:bifunctional riboflavin kinase/FAD synthetase [Porcincola intestinalis]|uniref:Riboflavin biosynthesis protein n=1 Tax=Porcincola intestinalis TaxID=2606632 RepID=A0A6L5X3R9_9FIRM|nr:bifunctional riboflavin kinase/FAD synthetase [Porcincola intestinalis]MSS14840.1 bifunctional riboflavin kinase/FAD synthetase [Porcincola intestinalis]
MSENSMLIYHGIHEFQSACLSGDILLHSSAVTLGKFDGVHRGHQKLLSEVLRRQQEGLTGIMFAIDSGGQQILTEQERASYVASLGMDVLIECPFSKELMTMQAEAFIGRVLKEILHAAVLVVGSDFRFGYGRAGSAQMLLDRQKQYGYRAVIETKECYQGREISSTRIRSALKAGDMDLTEALLGRPYPVSGRVVHGRHLGSTIGFPTVNILPSARKLLPPDGVYATVTELQDGRCVPGVTNIGTNPTISDGNDRTVETYLLDFSEDLYGTDLQTRFYHRIRGEEVFSSLEELTAQMKEDAGKGLHFLSRRGVLPKT